MRARAVATRFRSDPFLLGAAALVFALGTARADDWPHWRGPEGTGVSREAGLPTEWGPDRNVAWRVPLGGLAVSTPVVSGDLVFVTSQVGGSRLREGRHPTLVREEGASERPLGGRREEAAGKVAFMVEAFRREDGVRAWQYRLPALEPLPPVHEKHNLASPSPVADAERVYAWFGTGQLVALDRIGALVWQRNLAQDYGPYEISWGHSSSPTLHDGVLYLLCDHEPASYLLALDARTGREKWKVDRGDGLRSYSTPLVARGPEGPELIVNSSEAVEAYDSASGERLWYYEEANRFPVPSPSFEAGVLYMSRGYRSGPYMALRTGGRGDVTRSHLVWRVATGAPYVSSIVQYRGLVYMVTGNGIASCVDGKTGERLWQERIGGVFSASPVAGDGKVYLLAEDGETVVLEAARELRILSRNELGERTIASPALAGGRIYIRTDAHLYGIGRGMRGGPASGTAPEPAARR